MHLEIEAPAAADTVVLTPAVPATVLTAVPATVLTAVPATVLTAVPANVHAAVPANVHAAVPANVHAAVPANVPTDVPATVPSDVPSCNAYNGCRDPIFQVLSLLVIQANSDMNHLPSAKDRKVARVKEDLTEDGFRRVKSLFWKGVKGWIKVLLPAWNLPDDKVLKKLFPLPSAPFDDKDGAVLKEQVPLMITPWLQRISSKPSNRRNRSIL